MMVLILFHQSTIFQELVIQTTSGVEDAIETVEAVQTIEEVPEQQPEQTEFIVYQEEIGGTEQYYTRRLCQRTLSLTLVTSSSSLYLGSRTRELLLR